MRSDEGKRAPAPRARPEIVICTPATRQHAATTDSEATMRKWDYDLWIERAIYVAIGVSILIGLFAGLRPYFS